MVRSTLRFCHFTAAAALLLGLSIAAEEPTVRHDLGESMPQVLYGSYSTHSYATWVAASAALEPSGDVAAAGLPHYPRPAEALSPAISAGEFSSTSSG